MLQTFKKTAVKFLQIAILPVIFLPRFVFSAVKIINPIGTADLTIFLKNILNIVIMIAIPIVVLAIVYAGFLFVTAQGNEAEVTKAKKIFWWTIIGALIILGSKVIATAIGDTVATF